MPGNICVLCEKNLILDEEDVCAQCELSTANVNSKNVETIFKSPISTANNIETANDNNKNIETAIDNIEDLDNANEINKDNEISNDQNKDQETANDQNKDIETANDSNQYTGTGDDQNIYTEIADDYDNDIETDTTLNCGSCNIFVEEDSESLYCEVCDRWFHNACLETPVIRKLYILLNGAPNNVKWFCDKCIWITEKWIKTFPTITLNERRGKSRRFNTAVNNFKTLIENELEYDYTKEPEVKIEVDNDDVAFDINDSQSTDSEEYGGRKKKKKKKPTEKKKPKLKRNIADSEKIYQCTFCDASFHQPFLLNRHCRRLHPGLEPFKCSLCDKAFFRENKLKIHERTHSGKKPFQCSLCEKSFSREGWLEKHQIFHTSDKPYQCRDCEMCFETQVILKEHRKTHIGDKSYICSHCGQTFARRRKLKIHERIHTGEKPYKCKFCEKCFGNPDVHKKHQRTHSESKIYQCSTCGKGFARPDHLRKHESIHTGEKPFICSTCGKGFHRKDHLRKHEKYHTGEKPYQCSYCGKDFVRLDNFKAHEKIHTGEKTTRILNPHRSKASSAMKSSHHLKTEISNDSYISMPIFTQQNSTQSVITNSMSGPQRNSLSSNNPAMASSTPYTIPMSSPFLQARPMLNSSSDHTPSNFNPLHQMPIRLMSNQQLSQIEGWSNVGRWVNSGTWGGNYEDSN